MSERGFAAMIDQTLLKPGVGLREAADWIAANAGYGFAALVVPPFAVPVATQTLAGTATAVCSVVGFPFGYALTETKAEEAAHLAELGCREVDVVANIGALLEGEDAFAHEDLRVTVDAVKRASGGQALVKVIIETGHLSADRIARASRLAVDAGAAFVKTSTGFGPRGASVADVRAIRATVGDSAGVKASGGIRDHAFAEQLVAAGATRIGTSSGLAIVEGAEAARRSREGHP